MATTSLLKAKMDAEAQANGPYSHWSTIEAAVEIMQAYASGANGGVIIADTALHPGPFSILKAQGGDVVIASGTLPAGWSGSLAGLTIPSGDPLVIAGMTAITLTSGTAVAYN